MTSVWVAGDSTNQPERNRAGPAWKPHSMTPKVMKSNPQLIGPRKSMNQQMKPPSHRLGATCSGSLVGGSLVLAYRYPTLAPDAGGADRDFSTCRPVS